MPDLDNSGDTLTLPAPQSADSRREAKLLAIEAREYLAIARITSPVQKGQSLPRKESGRRITNCTGERLLREEPRRYRLIASMRAEGLGIRQTCRAAHCDARTVASVERLEAKSAPTVKAGLVKTFGQIAKCGAERILEELPRIPIHQMSMVVGIATDKLQVLTGDPNQRIEVSVEHKASGNLFDRLNSLADQITRTVQEKVIQAREVPPLQLQEEAP